MKSRFNNPVIVFVADQSDRFPPNRSRGGRVEKRNHHSFGRDRNLPTAEELDMEIDQYREEHKMLL